MGCCSSEFHKELDHSLESGISASSSLSFVDVSIEVNSRSSFTGLSPSKFGMEKAFLSDLFESLKRTSASETLAETEL